MECIEMAICGGILIAITATEIYKSNPFLNCLRHLLNGSKKYQNWDETPPPERPAIQPLKFNHHTIIGLNVQNFIKAVTQVTAHKYSVKPV